ncbi:hypothetical protein ES288_A11G067200v1 [Gossypium darwinii]|uniref:Reverse transcriptase zinc-binding domain-containing protein n=1 Tax=Gossypium darwinii TaxID=34276 RepID=A0A5D2EGU2_GOSDA|nr:hypothetical protein ES288_A11G067200v1 [Gossypium darwinii]
MASWVLHLRSKKVTENARCPRCRLEEEDSSHIFCFCPAISEIWNLINLSWTIVHGNQSFWEWLTWVFERSTIERCRFFCCALWCIWSSRNQLVHEKKIIPVRDLTRKVSNYIVELDGIRLKTPTFHTKRAISHTRGMEGITAQFDTAFDRINTRSASGIVVRDHMGDLKASKTVIHEDIPTPFAVEALAGLDAMKLVIEIGLTKSLLGAIIYDIQIRKSRVQEVTFKFIHRTMNIQAYNLAKAALMRRKDTYLGGETTIHRVADPKGRWREPPD